MPLEFNQLFWPAATVAAYVCARLFYRRHAYWWTSTLVVAPALLLALAIVLFVRRKHIEPHDTEAARGRHETSNT